MARSSSPEAGAPGPASSGADLIHAAPRDGGDTAVTSAAALATAAAAASATAAARGDARAPFVAALRRRWQQADSLVCVGLDPEPAKFPTRFAGDDDAVFAFCRDIADASAGYACAFKPQIAHFAALGAEDALQRLIVHLQAAHPDVPVILDAKRGDIGSTASRYAAEAFTRYRADAVTVNPYLGADSLAPFLAHRDRGVVILCRTSNPGATDLQDLVVQATPGKAPRPLYQHVAETAARDWNALGNCALVVGATWPGQLREVRAIVGVMPLLVPGVGAQGGDVEAVVTHAKSADGTGLMVSASRAILYASSGDDYAAAAAGAARDLRDTINRHR